MPSRSLVISSADPGDVLVAALSGRALAAAAARAGLRPIVLDLFCDVDTRALAPRSQRLPGSLAAIAWAARQRAAIVRVHDVAATRAFLDVWDAIEGHRA